MSAAAIISLLPFWALFFFFEPDSIIILVALIVEKDSSTGMTANPVLNFNSSINSLIAFITSVCSPSKRYGTPTIIKPTFFFFNAIGY